MHRLSMTDSSTNTEGTRRRDADGRSGSRGPPKKGKDLMETLRFEIMDLEDENSSLTHEVFIFSYF